MPHTIVQIEAVGQGRRARRLLFDDGDSRTISASVAKALGLDAGVSVSEDALSGTEAMHAKERALRLIGYREQAPAELVRRLVTDGYPESLAHETVQRFEELELVDEVRFAHMWARTRMHAGKGRRAIERELRERGVSDDVAGAAIAALTGSEEERAVAQVRRERLTDRTGREKEIRRLVSRGFDLRVAVNAVSRVAEGTGVGGDDLPFISE